jgi:NAD(P)H-hydrate epimerase
MIPILSAAQIREADAYTIANEPVASIDLMERAAAAFVDSVSKWLDPVETIHVFCGLGNNGGDGLVAARLFFAMGHDVQTYVFRYSDQSSEDFDVNLKRLQEAGGHITEVKDEPERDRYLTGIVIDAIFGSGLSRPIDGFVADWVEFLNNAECLRIAIDISSGLQADLPSIGTIFQADHTLTFQVPKLAFLMPENEKYVGTWEVLPIGLDQSFIADQETAYWVMNREAVSSTYKKPGKFDHKGTNGHALLIAGSKGKMGAALLAANACLRAGAGLVTLHVPGSGLDIVQRNSPEIMVSVDTEERHYSNCPDLDPYQAIGIGPGLGTHEDTVAGVDAVLQYARPVVIDADALNGIASHELTDKIPTDCILTPHPKELERLVGPFEDSFDRLKKACDLAVRTKSIVVLKGAYTAIIEPGGQCYFNPSGNPGLATAGSGDVLTGIITSLKAQGYSSLDAARLGVYVHGMVADILAEDQAMETIIAGDLVKGLTRAFQSLQS